MPILLGGAQPNFALGGCVFQLDFIFSISQHPLPHIKDEAAMVSQLQSTAFNWIDLINDLF
jgi:hypothetical protein